MHTKDSSNMSTDSSSDFPVQLECTFGAVQRWGVWVQGAYQLVGGGRAKASGAMRIYGSQGLGGVMCGGGDS